MRTLTLLLLFGTAHALPANSHVVVIGNNFGDPHELGLRFAQDDAQAVAEVLRRLGGVPSKNITAILDGDADAVRTGLLEVNAAIRATDPAALVVYYSGHADADALHLGGTYLKFKELKALVKSSPARLRLLVVDACRSGGVSRVKGVKAGRAFKLDVVEESAAEGLAIITSSTANESSQEADALRASFFSHRLVNALRGAGDRDGDGSVTLAEAYAYAYDGTIRSSGRTLDLQHPTYAWDVKGRGGLVMTRTAEAQARSGRLKLGGPVVHLVSDAAGGQVVAEVRPARKGAVLSLPPRAYRIQERRARTFLDYSVTLKPGQTVDLAKTPSTTIEYDRLVRKGGGSRRAVHGFLLLGGGRGQIVPEEGPTPHLVAGYTLDTRWLSAGLRARASVVEASADEGRSPRRREEYGGGLTLHRAVDLEWLTVAVGLLAEVAWHRQVFTEDDAPTRSSVSGAFGAMLIAERILFGGLSLHLEAGPVATVLRFGDTDRGAEVDPETRSETTWWAAGGSSWRL